MNLKIPFSTFCIFNKQKWLLYKIVYKNWNFYIFFTFIVTFQRFCEHEGLKWTFSPILPIFLFSNIRLLSYEFIEKSRTFIDILFCTRDNRRQYTFRREEARRHHLEMKIKKSYPSLFSSREIEGYNVLYNIYTNIIRG